MAADAERLIACGGARQLSRFGRGARVGHDGRGGDDAVLVRLRDGAIHACCEAKIIGIDDEPSHGSSVASVSSSYPPTNASISFSSITATPNSRALSSFDPASAPATT